MVFCQMSVAMESTDVHLVSRSAQGTIYLHSMLDSYITIKNCDSNTHNENFCFVIRYQLIRISNKGLRENSKWLQMFDDVSLVIFCVSVSDYDECYEDADGSIVNKMIESRQLFESIVLHPTFEQMNFLLLLTKFDLLEQKIGKSPLTACDWFAEFTPLVSRNLIDGTSRSKRGSHNGASLAQMAAHYIGMKFKRLFHSLTERKLYVSYVNALDQQSVCSAIRYGREIVKWEEDKPVFGSSETVYSGDEPSSYSH